MGGKLTLADLPLPTCDRWSARKKAEVVAAVNGGLLSEQAAIARYGLCDEEYRGWSIGSARAGLSGLRVTRLRR